MQAYVLRHWSIVRLGSTAAEKKLFFNLRRLRAKSDSAGLGYMNPEQLADVASDLDVDIAAVETMDGRLNGNDQSLNTFLTSDTDREWQDLLPDDGPSPEETVIDERERSTRRNWLALGMDDLPAREAMIIRSRHLGEETTTLEHLGRQLGISKERVRQLERRALDRLKKSVSRRGDGGSSMTTGATARLNRPSAPGSC